MKFRMMIIAAAIAVATAATGIAQLSMAKADWARGPVQYLMTKDELAQWNALKSDAEADQFIALFWAKRDPDKLRNPQNAFRANFDARVQAADQNFSTARQKGSLTDRGKVLILFGPPSRPIARTGGRGGIQQPTTPSSTMNPAGAPAGSEAEDTSSTEQQLWTYEGATAEQEFGAPRVELRFIDRMGTHDFRMETPRIDFAAAQQRAVTAAITLPNLTLADLQQQRQPQPAPATAQPVTAAPAASAAPTTTLKTAALEAAVANVKPSSKVMVSYAEFVSPTGEYFVPLALYVPASAGLAADAADTFFGVIQDASGNRVLAFEDPATLTASKNDFFVDRTLALPSGKYTGVFGLAKAGTPILVTSAPLQLTTLSKDSTGTSGLILSNNIYELQTAAPVKAPFAFGKEKIVPKADLVFTNKDDLDYFVEIHNPGLADVPLSSIQGMAPPAATTTGGPSTPMTVPYPKLQMKLDLVDSKGTTLAGNPLADADIAPLSGHPGAGEYAIVSGIPLSQLKTPLKPGEYVLKMKIIDTVKKQSFNVEQKFKIVA